MSYKTETPSSALPATPDNGTAVVVPSSDWLGSVWTDLPPLTKHAYETYQIALSRGDAGITIGEIRTMIRWLYGPEVDAAIDKHINDRINAVLPNTKLRNAASEPSTPDTSRE